MVNLTRIYTRTGDDGSTSLGDFSRTSKTDLRLEAYADVDEANSAIGVVLAVGEPAQEIVAVLGRVQNELFDVGADLCTPLGGEGPQLRVRQDYIERLEADCDTFNADLPNLRSFILPGGTPASAYLHVARTVTRRAERATWAAFAEHGDTMNPPHCAVLEPVVRPAVHPRAGREPWRRRAVGAGWRAVNRPSPPPSAVEGDVVGHSRCAKCPTTSPSRIRAPPSFPQPLPASTDPSPPVTDPRSGTNLEPCLSSSAERAQRD